jgi:hypothetical protein
MGRAAIFRYRFLALLQCLALLVDCLLSVLISFITLIWALLTGQEGAAPSPYETMSARAGRGMLDRKLIATVCAWCIDRVFALWQGPIAQLPGSRTFTHPSHCVRAFIKTREGAYLPREYHGPLPPSIEACYRRKDAP